MYFHPSIFYPLVPERGCGEPIPADTWPRHGTPGTSNQLNTGLI